MVSECGRAFAKLQWSRQRTLGECGHRTRRQTLVGHSYLPCPWTLACPPTYPWLRRHGAWGEMVGTQAGSKGGGGVWWDGVGWGVWGPARATFWKLTFLAASTTNSQGRCTGRYIQRVYCLVIHQPAVPSSVLCQGLESGSRPRSVLDGGLGGGERQGGDQRKM